MSDNALDVGNESRNRSFHRRLGLCRSKPTYLGARAAVLLIAIALYPLPGLAAEGRGSVQIHRSLVFKTLDSGQTLLADVYLPVDKAAAAEASTDGEPSPTLLMIHGGAWFSGNKVHVTYHAKYAAAQGYAVVAINYRLAPKFKFPAQLEDCRDALQWMAKNAERYRFDLTRVGIYGYSAGGQLACLAGLSQPTATHPQVRAIVAGGAPCEFSWIPAEAKTLEYWLGASRSANPEIYAAASPTEFVDVEDPPVFLFHGAADRVVPLDSPRKMSALLNAASVITQLHVVEDGSHIGAFLDKKAREKAIDFLDRHLRE